MKASDCEIRTFTLGDTLHHLTITTPKSTVTVRVTETGLLRVDEPPRRLRKDEKPYK